ncbi:MAG: aminoglycoside N(3)-acetyltransferase [Candidatus Latescibacteria bacterium]|nr:aminoglycoside N(3)-acetyltransferase [Candidatus Latescibacterota bacterium]
MKRDELESQFRRLGLDAGDIVFVHSSLGSIGYVEGGADTVVDALLGVLGDDGTLVVPTFTFGQQDRPFNPATDPSGMGRISETVRTRPQALRSIHRSHSVAAIGRQAETITSVHGPAALAADGPFGQLYALDARILLLGVSYQTCTFLHVAELLVQVPYRQSERRQDRVLEADGRQRPLMTDAHKQTADFPGNDFNKFGRIMEERGLVHIYPVGNAMARLFKARDALPLGIECYRQDPLIFVIDNDHFDFTPLRDGVALAARMGPGVEFKGVRYVVDPQAVFNEQDREQG